MAKADQFESDKWHLNLGLPVSMRSLGCRRQGATSGKFCFPMQRYQMKSYLAGSPSRAENGQKTQRYLGDTVTVTMPRVPASCPATYCS